MNLAQNPLAHQLSADNQFSMTNLNEARLAEQRSGYVNQGYEQDVGRNGEPKTDNVTTISR